MGNHPWDHEIEGWAVVSGSGLRVRPFSTEEAARAAAVAAWSPSDCIQAVYGPGKANRVAVYFDRAWHTPEAFDKARGFRSTDGAQRCAEATAMCAGGEE